MSTNDKKKVYVGMSGGVDSSLTAFLLKEKGYEVIGVFIKVWQPDFIECTWKEDRLDAMRVAAQLDIPFITLDLEKEYKKEVIDYMIEEYKNGRTPNPDVYCNRYVKFGAFLKWARENNADYIATGHYAKTDNLNLFKGEDNNKDQSYFLWTLNKNDLKNVLFPIGELKKSEVRKIAEKNNIFTSNKKDSQGLCFVGTVDIKTLLKEFIKEERGNVLNEEGEIIGYHDGAMFYTIGERHNFVITKKGTEEKPYYVIRKDSDKNTLIVSHNKPSIKEGDNFELTKINFVNEDFDENKIYEARARYRAPLSKIKIKRKDNSFFVEKIEGELVKTSGQSLVIYDGDMVLGGGIIV